MKHTHTHTFNGPLSGTTQVSQYQKGKTNLEFTGARDSEWQWHQLGHNASLHLAPDRQPHQHPTTLMFLQAGCPSCRPTNSVKALKTIIVFLLNFILVSFCVNVIFEQDFLLLIVAFSYDTVWHQKGHPHTHTHV